jgi:uncharacterized protein YndB with AHSA1/START domain
MITPAGSIAHETEVPIPADKAFDLFTARMTDWWPSDHHIGSAPIEEIVIEPRTGGRWYTRHTDGSETSTGYVVAWEPPTRLVITWQVGADWKYHEDMVTTLELQFTEMSSERTRVRLEHRDLDGFGPATEEMRTMFDSDEAWPATLTAYAAEAVSA